MTMINFFLIRATDNTLHITGTNPHFLLVFFGQLLQFDKDSLYVLFLFSALHFSGTYSIVQRMLCFLHLVHNFLNVMVDTKRLKVN